MATTNKNFIVKNGLDAAGDITTSGYLKSNNSSGDEGGEIFLSKSVTNTTISNGVTIDVYRDKLRFFEQGGTARGFYIDITTGGAGVATNLAGGAGTVTSVAMTVPTGLSISGSPITGSGTLALSLAAGYSIPTTANQTNWSTAYSWGDHASAGYASSSHNHTLDSLSNVTITTNAAGEILKWSGTAWINNTLAEAGISATGHTHAASDVTSGTFDIARIPTGTSGTTVALGNHTHSYQPLDTELTSIAALANSTGYLYNNGTGTFSYATPTDTNTTYTFASGTTNGAFSVTPSGGVAQSVSIFGLGTAAYTASSAYATSGHTHTGVYQPLATNLTSIGNLANGSGYLLNNGTGTFSYATPANWYPTAFSWTAGTTAGPTGSLTGTGMSAVSYAAIPSASSTASGVVTTGSQNFAGTKTFDGAIWVGGSAVNISSLGAYAGVSGSFTGSVTVGGSLTRSALAGGGSTTATFDNSGNLVRTGSSIRYKQDIADAEYAYEDVLALEPKTFRLKNEV